MFSFEHRIWGEVLISEISEIQFDKTAFDRTVIPDRFKKMIANLTKNFYTTECSNFVRGKGRGLVFLLDGRPGVGKTLTAHGISELLELPLYSIGSGDLGTDPKEIEHKLKRVFKMVEHWNGITLIDEADVFMSKRTEYDIKYNACVSVFLRLIETYSGILFLTTNKGIHIDEAFKSRIHIPLHYKELEEYERSLVWEESLNRHKIVGIDSSKLAVYILNNREITVCVSNALIEAGGKPENVDIESILGYIELRKQFELVATDSIGYDHH
jgi:SpoVK/Ycf46/Vps4 family AAA+-type ATPase